ncbi:hypothetical protein GL218_05428 [Daldinia childiae]|uniref:uncharacterized protein n=1 Tax=Daldinia childiae TaxID=326645 RepID=UPI0014488413|nr:uncharacterized protein GL218_05428 [Daldinia childiae]KAF3058576.1 hypothetical protein GL218_05428 [Daldinia childiae]
MEDNTDSKESRQQFLYSEFNFDVTSEFGLPESAISTVLMALSLARDLPDAFKNPKIETILKEALNRIWLKLLTMPSYVMTRNEFAVFNFFQDLDLDSTLVAIAINARARYWDETHGDA